jgi:hypothetical protein
MGCIEPKAMDVWRLAQFPETRIQGISSRPERQVLFCDRTGSNGAHSRHPRGDTEGLLLSATFPRS